MFCDRGIIWPDRRCSRRDGEVGERERYLTVRVLSEITSSIHFKDRHVVFSIDFVSRRTLVSRVLLRGKKYHCLTLHGVAIQLVLCCEEIQAIFTDIKLGA